jgi:hypothetical protein
MIEKLANVRLDHLVDTDLVNLVLHLLDGTNEFLRQLKDLCMMLAKSNADSIHHCSVLCSL